MKVLRYLPIGLLLTLAFSPPLQAQGLHDDSRLSFNGFGTLGLVHSNIDEAEFIRNIGQPEGVSDGWSADVDSLLGLQVGFAASETVDAVVQAVSRYHHTGDYSPEMTWAFLRYVPDPSLQLRAGRLGWDVYMLSDARHVGYAYLWARPPVDHFGILQLNHIDGADVTVKRPVGGGLAWAKLFAGRSDGTVYLDDDFVLESEKTRVLGGHINYETGPWHWRLGYTAFESDPTYSGAYVEYLELLLQQNVDALLTEATGLGRVEFLSAGATYHRGPWQVQAMWNRTTLDNDVTHVDSGFVSGGYRLGKVTPYLVFAQADTHAPGPTGEGDYQQQTYSIGMRYDVAANVALKAQVDRVDVEDPGVLWRDVEPGWDGWATLFSLGLDFVF